MIRAERASDHAPDAEALRAEGHTSSSPRIAYLLSQYPARSHTFLLNEVLGLRARGLHIDVASINSPDRALNALPPQEAAEAQDTFYIKRTSRIRTLVAFGATALGQPAVIARGLHAILRLPSLSLRQRGFWLFYLAEAILIGRWMQQRSLSHLHVHFGGAVASVGMLASIAWQLPYSLTIHGPEELLNPAPYQLESKLGQASFVICISDFCRNELCKLRPPAEGGKFTVIRLGVNPLQLAPQDRGEHEVHPTPVLVCVGRLVPEKGHRTLLDALSQLRQRNIALQSVFIGAGPLQRELQQHAAELQLEDRVTFTSGLSHEETLAHVRSADLFALASFAEGVPVALMEAMSLGVPCVSTSVAGIPELIRDGEDGLLVPPGDAVAFANALQVVITDPSRSKRFSQAGRQRVVSEYNLPLNLDRLAQHLRHYVTQATLRQPTIAADAYRSQA